MVVVWIEEGGGEQGNGGSSGGEAAQASNQAAAGNKDGGGGSRLTISDMVQVGRMGGGRLQLIISDMLQGGAGRRRGAESGEGNAGGGRVGEQLCPACMAMTHFLAPAIAPCHH